MKIIVYMKKFMVIMLVCSLMFSTNHDVTSVRAVSSVKPYIAFGASLKDNEKQTVMKFFNVTDTELDDYVVIEVTNDEEHRYLDKYLASDVIGTRALSSVKIEENDAGEGIDVTTHNINFCTGEMYTNALVTAGIEDAKVTVAGPFELSGTAALVGAIKAYSAMTGEDIDNESADAAINELVMTGDISDDVGSDKASQFIALLKNKVVEGSLSSDEDILNAIDETAAEIGVDFNDDERAQILDVMKKIAALDLDIDTIQSQAQGIYDRLSDLGIDIADTGGFLSSVGDFFSTIGDAIGGFFSGLF